MYVPHQYGITDLSVRDIETLKCLYDLPLGYDYRADLNRLGLPANTTIDELVAEQKGWAPASTKPAKVDNKAPDDPQALERQQDLLHQRGLFYLQTSHLMMNDET